MSIKFVSQFIFYYSTVSNVVYADQILYLKFPKLIYNLELNKQKSQIFVNDINKSIVDINSSVIDSNTKTKFDKKYKNDLVYEDNLSTRKNKIKTNKKNRKKTDLDKDDLFIDNNTIFTKESNSFLKSHKINKYKKKDKSIDQIKSAKNNVDFSFESTDSMSKDILIDTLLTVKELSLKLDKTESEIITYLFLKGISVTINDVIDIEIAKEVALNYNFNIIDKKEIKQIATRRLRISNDVTNLSKRAPIITIFGHVDHGKTTLLDAILKTNFVNQEYGQITQSISGYEIEYSYGSLPYKLLFLDTPGHEAFTSMRLRGAKVADIILLVIAADDGLKPQTLESIQYILEMDLPYIVVINKIDKENINIVKLKEDLVQHGILSQELGGNASIVEVSALTSKNIDLLLHNICSLSELQNLTTDIQLLAQGTILEAYLDSKQGVIAHIIIQEGILRIGDLVVAGNVAGKIKSLINIKNQKVKEAGPSSIIQVLGFSELPQSGIAFKVVNNEKEAKKYIDDFIKDNMQLFNKKVNLLNKRISLPSQVNLKDLKLILKTDTQGSLEAIMHAFSKISQSKVQISIINASSGNISNTDIDLALSTNALILGFNINVSSHINHSVKQKNLNLKIFYIIYDLIDYVTNCMLNLVDVDYEYTFIGSAVVQTVFNMNKGAVAGCLVNEGKLKKMCYIKVYTNNDLVYEGNLISLKRGKDNVDEVLQNNECGVMCDYNLWKKIDIIEAYDINYRPKFL
uniref:Translation initiation factor IF-2, chloroplastic n=1 Tax=Dipterocladia arabiensis TaxID=2007176 RepID=A0A1Z1M075_9FLOR|nr:translation initiation factor 2 [Dipterocladia arabiensis]ARW59388.1 translation initiation factor 2 [Dipterocladia arabiensis]